MQRDAADDLPSSLLVLARQFRELADLLSAPRRSVDHRCLRLQHDVTTLIADSLQASVEQGLSSPLERLVTAIGPSVSLELTASQLVPESGEGVTERDYDVVIVRESTSAREAYAQISAALDLLRWGGVVILADYSVPDPGRRANSQFLASQRAVRENPSIAVLRYPPEGFESSGDAGLALLARVPG